MMHVVYISEVSNETTLPDYTISSLPILIDSYRNVSAVTGLQHFFKANK